eukprot:g4932.t1
MSSSSSSSSSSAAWAGEEESKGGGGGGGKEYQEGVGAAEEFAKPLDPIMNAAEAGTVTTLAGSGEEKSEDGVGAAASFKQPSFIACSLDSKQLFVADYAGHKIRVVSVADGAVTTLAGSGERKSEDGVGAAASFNHPFGLALSPDGKQLFVTGLSGNTIRVVNVADGAVTTLAGSGAARSEDGVGAAASFRYPRGLALSPDGKQLFVSEHAKIRVVNVADGAVTTLAGSGELSSEDGVGAAASFYCPRGLALSLDGKQLFVAGCRSRKIRVVTVADGAVTTLAGSGAKKSKDRVGAAASFNEPYGLALSPDGKQLFVTELSGNKIRAVNVTHRAVTTLAGSGRKKSEDGVGATASFSCPMGLAVIAGGKQLAVPEFHGNKIRLVQLPSAAPPIPPIVIPPSTLLDDFQKTMDGSLDLPDGKVTFIVGPERKRFERLMKGILCVRSEYFDRMFRNRMAEGGGGAAAAAAAAGGAAPAELEIEVPDTDPASFQTLLDYITKDQVGFPGGPQHAFSTLQLARKHGVVRLERLCLQALEDEQLTAESAVPMLEAARAVGSGIDGGVGEGEGDDGAAAGGNRLFDTCRRFILDHGKAVKDAGGFEQLQEMPVAVGLLGDAVEEVDRLRTKYEPDASDGSSSGGGSRKRRRQE